MEFPTLARGARLLSLGLHDDSGKEIGKVVEWVMDVNEGKVVYVIAEFFTSPGYYPILWNMLIPNGGNTGYIVDQTQAMRRELFMNTHDLFEVSEDPYFLEKIAYVHSSPNQEMPRRNEEPEQIQSNGQRARAYSPSRDYIPLDAVPQLQMGE